MEPPIEFDDFANLKKREAQKVFDWFVSIIPERIDLLKMLYEIDGLNKTELDFTLESLDKVWKWFIPKINYYSVQNLEKEILEELLPAKGSFIYDFSDHHELYTYGALVM